MSLERDRSTRETRLRAVRLGVIHHLPTIDHDLHSSSAHDGVKGEPLVIAPRLADIPHGVQAAGTTPVRLRIIDLYLVPLRGETSVLVRRADEKSRVRARLGQDVRLYLEVLELVIHGRTIVEQVRSRTMDDDLAILDPERCRVLAGAPSRERLSVE